MSIETALDEFGKYMVQQSRSNLTRLKKKDTGALYNSLQYEVISSPNSVQFTFSMENYGDFVDKGVRGAKEQKKAPDSPYKFGSGKGGKGLTTAIAGWVKRKRFQFRSPKGQFMSFAQTSFIISRSVWNTGLKTTNFYQIPYDRAIQRIPTELAEQYAIDTMSLLANTFKQ